MFGYFDPQYLLYIAPAFLLAMVASLMTRMTFNRYSKVRASSGMTGAEAAHRLLTARGIHCSIEETAGMLSDHYDPRTKTLRLSHDVYHSPSLSAIGVACHEAGHAIQDSERYPALAMRSTLVPITMIGSNAAPFLFLIGFLLSAPSLVYAGIILFGAVVLFSIVTLPVEWDASARAKSLMVRAGIVNAGEAVMAGRVLNAAFMTYLASALMAVMQLLYYLMRAGLLGRRDD